MINREDLNNITVSNVWTDLIIKGNPKNREETKKIAKETWKELNNEQRLESFHGHILLSKASRFQGKNVPKEVVDEITKLDYEYIEQFGHMCIIFCERFTAEEILKELRERFSNSKEEEFAVCCEHKLEIILWRIENRKLEFE
jgi:hypothetical protein